MDSRGNMNTGQVVQSGLIIVVVSTVSIQVDISVNLPSYSISEAMNPWNGGACGFGWLKMGTLTILETVSSLAIRF